MEASARGCKVRAQVVVHRLQPCDWVPNNPGCPLLIYRRAVPIVGADAAVAFETLFAANGWVGAWRNGVFDFQHFHSTAHEALGIFSGEVRVAFGGEKGICVEAAAGDVIVVPAGVSHRRVSSRTLGVVGAYPEGQSPDLCVATDADHETLRANVARVPRPLCDPVHGGGGPLHSYWVS